MRSSYVLESGFYITPFAATILITSLATIGLLMITMLVALTMMLQSCQSRGSGVIELQSVNDDYSYCKVHSLHTELNSLEGHNLPSICKDLAIEYVKGGRYARDLEVYFDKVKPSDDGVGVVLIDIDGIFPQNPSDLYQRFHDISIVNCQLFQLQVKHGYQCEQNPNGIVFYYREGSFLLKTHLQPTIFLSIGSLTKTHVLFLWRDSTSALVNLLHPLK
ncbi:uncharacterized protein At2g39920-like [Arachis ipaensis]|nr:uncharacterized protein At2g39920-like [Arachis ipaensis]XP_016169781.1 uncharacterized protein At2g39920-like [Arachis ipaensis]XP_029151089.1 uncharacterized protein At2g39920-like [Arachis hypogaea]XP_029151090.1 uncharacterized protein At2g39920-like [Arachis hypogaea]RYQ95663.1 hypothetical protein Ahy_B08g091008 isoform B [Arachis hypogaea]